MIATAAAGAFFLVALVNVLFWPKVRSRGMSGGRVAVLIPARDEEHNLAGCLETVLSQAAVNEILIYDDHSTDETAAIAGRFAARDARVRLIAPRPLPSGWCGKNFACAQLAAQANAEWMLFLDADARLNDGAIPRMLAEARSRGVTLLSCWPRFELLGFWERALMPMLNFVVFTLFPAPLSLRRGDASLGLAHGACIFAQRAAYERTGGHSLVRDEIFEDTALARRWREKGETSLCLDGSDIVRVRMYCSLADIWRGFEKNFYPAFRHRWTFAAFLLLHAAVFFAPFLTANWLAIGLILGTRALLAIRFRQPWWSMFAHPFAEAFLIALGISSWWACRGGRGVQWKGRRYRALRA